MEFGVFTFIIPNTNFNSIKKYMGYELKPDENSQILFTYDNEPDKVNEFDMKTKPKMRKKWHSLRQTQGFPQQYYFQTDFPRQFYVQTDFPQQFYFQIEKGVTLFVEDEPLWSEEHGIYTLKTLHQIFHKHNNWTKYKQSIYNCMYYINDPTPQNAVSILKISSNRYLFAYQPKYLTKPEVEQIVFELFM